MMWAIVLVETEEVAKIDESRWRQKFKILWLKQGDNNTKFIQKMAIVHNRYYNIDILIINGKEIKDLEAIKVNMIELYKKLYTKSKLWRPTFELVNCPRIS